MDPRSGQSQSTVIVLGDDERYRRELSGALAQRGITVWSGGLTEDALGHWPSWTRASHHDLGVAVAIVDATSDPERGLALLDALRGRSWTLPVVLLVRRLGQMPRTTLGAYMLIEGQQAAGTLASELVQRFRILTPKEMSPGSGAGAWRSGSAA